MIQRHELNVKIKLSGSFLLILFFAGALTRALMGCGELQVLIGGAQRAPLRFSGTNSWIGKIQTAFERSHRGAPDLVPLTSLT